MCHNRGAGWMCEGWCAREVVCDADAMGQPGGGSPPQTDRARSSRMWIITQNDPEAPVFLMSACAFRMPLILPSAWHPWRTGRANVRTTLPKDTLASLWVSIDLHPWVLK